MDDNFHGRLRSLESNVLGAIDAWGDKMQASLDNQLQGLLPNMSQPHPLTRLGSSHNPTVDENARTVRSSVHDGFVRLRSIADLYKNEKHSFTEEDEDRVYLLGFAEDVVSDSGRGLSITRKTKTSQSTMSRSVSI